MAKRKFDEELQRKVLDYVREYGHYRDFQHIAGGISDRTIERYIDRHDPYFDAGFRAAYEKACKVWQAKHPEQNAEYAILADEKYRALLEKGHIEINEKYDEKDKMLYRFVKKAPPPRWVIERALPDQNFTQQSIFWVVPNQMMLVQSAEAPTEFREKYIFITRFLEWSKKKMVEELHKAGLPVGMLED